MESNSIKGKFADLGYYWRVLVVHKWIILFSLFSAVLVATAILYFVQPVYRATTTLLIEAEQSRVQSIDDMSNRGNSSSEYLKTQFEILKSRELAERAIERLDLTGDPRFDSRQQQSDWLELVLAKLPLQQLQQAPSEAQFKNAAVSQFTSALDISPVEDTRLVKLHFEHTDPEFAATVANTMADIFIESHLEARLEATQKLTGWLSSRLGGLRERLQSSEANLQEYREQAELVGVDGVQTIGAEEVEQLTQRYVEAKNKRSQAETVYSQVSKLGNSPSVEQMLTIPGIQSQSLVQRLKQSQSDAQRKLHELSLRYGPKHPKLISALIEAQSVSSDLELQSLRAANGIATDYRAALQTERALEIQLEDARARLQNVNRKEFKLKELEREVEANRQLYELFLTRYKASDEAIGLQSPHARVIDDASVPVLPVKPQKGLILLLVALSSVFVSALAVLFRDAQNNNVRTPDDVEEKLHTNMLGFLPEVKLRRKSAAAEGFLAHQDESFAESIRTIRSGLLLSKIDRTLKVTVITSSVPEEGKSTLALNLAESMAQMERVLLIDADMRRPTLAKRLGLARTSPGLANVVAGTADFAKCVHKLKDTGVDVLTSGLVTAKPLELLSSDKFAQLMQSLVEKYDRIIIDSAPTFAVSDAMILSGYADAVVYVVRYDETAAPLAARGIRRLQEVNAAIAGVVLNRVKVKKAAGYGSYHAGYYGNYGYSADVTDFSRALEKRAASV